MLRRFTPTRRRSTMHSRVERITPEIAAQYLKRNHPRNRPGGRKRLEEFKQILRDGRWETTHQGIAFDEEGYLIDGQKRLMAVIETGVTIEVMVTRGVTAKGTGAIDTPQYRNAANRLYMG